METAFTLSEIFQQARCQFSVYDLSRRVTRINADDFIQIEKNHQAYPFPIQKKAQFAIAFWKADATLWIWFLTFPLDERGLLNQAAVGDFIQFVGQAMGARVDADLSEAEQQKLVNNPYTFSPHDDKKAIFHARLTNDMQHNTSPFYDDACAYLRGELGWQAWESIGLQGIADVCVRLEKDPESVDLTNALHNLPDQPKYALLGCLEHIHLPDSLALDVATSISTMIEQTHADLFMLAAYLRALSGANHKLLTDTICQLLKTPHCCHKEILIAIAGRCWQALTVPDLLDQFLLQIAKQNDAAFFHAMVADLVSLPLLRPSMLNILHHHTSPELLRAVTALQQKKEENA